MDKEKVKQNAKDIKEKADEILNETEDEDVTPQKKKSGKARGDPMVTLYD